MKVSPGVHGQPMECGAGRILPMFPIATAPVSAKFEFCCEALALHDLPRLCDMLAMHVPGRNIVQVVSFADGFCPVDDVVDWRHVQREADGSPRM